MCAGAFSHDELLSAACCESPAGTPSDQALQAASLRLAELHDGSARTRADALGRLALDGLRRRNAVARDLVRRLPAAAWRPTSALTALLVARAAEDLADLLLRASSTRATPDQRDAQD